MPNGRVHARISKRFRFLSILASAGTYYAWEDWILSISVLPGYLLGAMVDPDMDLPKKNTYAKQLWRRTIIFAWMVPWWNLYGILAQRFLGGHRSFWTHMPGISTIMRLAWMCFPFGLIGRIISPGTMAQVLVSPMAHRIMLGVFIGLTLSDTIHAISDLIWRE